MKDLKFLSVPCDHKIFDEILEVDGLTPNFYAYTQFDINVNKTLTFIRDYNSTEPLDIIYPNINGITNYAFSFTNTKLILFGSDSVTAGMNYPDGNPDIVPRNEILIDYATLIDGCPKCRGTGKVNDVFYEPTGDLAIVEGTNKLVQQVLKALMTNLGDNIYDPLYGSGLQSLVGEQLSIYTSIRLQQYVQDCIFHLQQLQQSQSLTPEETILRINDIGVTVDQQDPSKVNIIIVITNGSYQEVPINLTISL